MFGIFKKCKQYKNELELIILPEEISCTGHFDYTTDLRISGISKVKHRHLDDYAEFFIILTNSVQDA